MSIYSLIVSKINPCKSLIIHVNINYLRKDFYNNCEKKNSILEFKALKCFLSFDFIFYYFIFYIILFLISFITLFLSQIIYIIYKSCNTYKSSKVNYIINISFDTSSFHNVLQIIFRAHCTYDTL